MTEKLLSYYLNESKKIKCDNSFNKKIKIALLSSFTISGIAETIIVKCNAEKINCSTYSAPYNQYVQQILDKNSSLHKFQPDLTFLILDSRSILGDLFYDPFSVSVSERKKIIIKKSSELLELINNFSKELNSTIIVTNLLIPYYSPYGIFENKSEYGIKEMIQDYNNILKDNLKNETSQYVFDFNSFVSKHGELNIFDYKQYFLGDIKISFKFLPFLAEEFLGFIKPFLGKNRKCIVLDLDNTLWGGIVGEDGYDGINLGATPPGNAFVEFQKYLLALNKRGIILAINSKNNENDALKVIREHPNMILREENFSAMRINWNDKISNMKDISNELNIGLDSLVFIDDDNVNRELMKKAIPEVLTIDVQKDPSSYVQTLQEINDLNVLKITDEDENRSKMYSEQKKRNEVYQKTSNLEEFLKDLEIQVNIKRADSFSIPRISQLTLKTNQFNLTTKRYQENEIRQMSNNEQFFIVSVNVKDKFGDNGISGTFIVEKKSNEWIIDTFLLSCRVIGRGVEIGIMSYLLQEAKNQGISSVRGEFIPTEKNQPASTLFQECDFIKNGNEWIFNLKNKIKIPKYLSIIK